MTNAIRLAAVGGLLAVLALPTQSASAAPACQPGSGAKLAGHHLTVTTIQRMQGLRCADLTGADLSGQDLTQADLTGVRAEHANLHDAKLIQADLAGADLKGADLSGADLGQATLTDADLSGADLKDAGIVQADAGGVILSGANLTNVHAAQADLRGATLDGATISGADFTQAELDGASFAGLKGLTDWSRYLAIGAAALFLLLGGLAVTRALGRRAARTAGEVVVPPTTPALAPSASAWARMSANRAAAALVPSSFNPINRPAAKTVGRGLGMGLFGALLVALGLHLFVGGLIGQFSFAFDSLATTTCSGPQCAVGLGSGMLGVIGGLWVALGGAWTLARA